MTKITKQKRLRSLENDIRSKADSIQQNGLAIGLALIEIRDDELWSDDYDSWNQYLKDTTEDLIGKTFTQSAKLIRAAEVKARIPTNSVVDDSVISPSHLTEIGRLAPDKPSGVGRGREKDYSKLRKQDVARVLKNATEASDKETPTVKDIRKAVDDDLGIDRAAKARATKKKQEQGIDVSAYILSKTGQIEAITEHLAELSADAWELLEESHPGLAKSLATACDELATLMRS